MSHKTAATVAQGVVAMYGSFTVDEANKTIIVKFEGSSFANSSVPRASGSSRRSMTTNFKARTQPPRPAPRPNRCGDA